MMISRLLSGLLFGVLPFDLETMSLTIVRMGAATNMAALIPAWRSARLQSMQALGTDSISVPVFDARKAGFRLLSVLGSKSSTS
jgi:DNA-binding IclR family transcriptional regulator